MGATKCTGESDCTCVACLEKAVNALRSSIVWGSWIRSQREFGEICRRFGLTRPKLMDKLLPQDSFGLPPIDVERLVHIQMH